MTTFRDTKLSNMQGFILLMERSLQGIHNGLKPKGACVLVMGAVRRNGGHNGSENIIRAGQIARNGCHDLRLRPHLLLWLL